ncbi:ABC transporter permease [Corynebacterium variabile]|uniref:ABC transporter permease n=1 Tax=Corynebacterium variabile TaxID=1727 RepID=UPI0026475AE4|nr:ABC transporter permease [Corynebacterium variabile]MDN6661715.1 ABC transporter permease [Corynebacterium variabile]MDN6675510.1 ABC transporter permease [Corynebacterium variabile]
MSFTNALRAETTKLFSLRSSLVYAILLTGSLFGPVTLIALFGDDATLDWSTILFGLQIFMLVAVIFAAATTAGDIRNHMHAQAFLTQAGRWQWVAAKITVTAAFTAVTYVLGTVLAIGVGAALGGTLSLGTDTFIPVVGLVTNVLFAAMSVGLACVIRSQVASVAVPVAWLLVIDGMLGMAAESIGIFRPLAAIAPMQRQTQLLGGEDPLGFGFSTAVCYLIIIAWFAALAALGLWRNHRVDVR